MAEGNDPGTTPPVPVNPFVGGGFEQNIDQQRGLSNDLIAQQGQSARALYDRTGASAKDVLQSQLSAAGGNPTARTALFQAYVDDAKAGEARSAQSVQRQAALGNMFMDQTKAAIPLYAKNVDATTEAMRLQFEERRRKEEQNYQLQRAQLASSNANRPKTGAAKGQEDAEADLAYWSVADAEGLNPKNPFNQIAGLQTIEAAAKKNKSEPVKDFVRTAADLGLPNWQVMTSRYPSMIKDMDYLQEYVTNLATRRGTKAVTFDDLFEKILITVKDDENVKSVGDARLFLVDYIMGANAGRWGAKPEDWSFNPAKYKNFGTGLYGPDFNPGNYSSGSGVGR